MSRVEIPLNNRDRELELLETIKRMEEQQNQMMEMIKSLLEKGGES